MNFDELHETIPYVKGGKEKILRYSPYPNITLAMPGRHAKDTTPVGGDFVVMVTDKVFPRPDHQFTHTDIFKQVELLRQSSFESKTADDLDTMKFYSNIITGSDPNKFVGWGAVASVDLMNNDTFLYAVQCLAVAEHRRYARYEKQWGGRYLPFRFAAGIAEGLWDAADAANLQRKGRPGVEILEKTHGTPKLTQELMK